MYVLHKIVLLNTILLCQIFLLQLSYSVSNYIFLPDCLSISGFVSSVTDMYHLKILTATNVTAACQR